MEVWRTLKKLKFLSAAPGVCFTLLSCSPIFSHNSIMRAISIIQLLTVVYFETFSLEFVHLALVLGKHN